MLEELSGWLLYTRENLLLAPGEGQPREEAASEQFPQLAREVRERIGFGKSRAPSGEPRGSNTIRIEILIINTCFYRTLT